MRAPRLLAVLAHPDDESLGVGGTLAKYASEGVEVNLLTATRGDKGRYRGIRPGDNGHPGAAELGRIRETELRAAAAMLGVQEVSLLDYGDQELDQANPRQAIGVIAKHIRRIRPDVIVTFSPDGAYGHPDHIAISQFTTAAIVTAAEATFAGEGAERQQPHTVSKLYYIAWPESAWKAYQGIFGDLGALVDGVKRRATALPDWVITTELDAKSEWSRVWKAIGCHESQINGNERMMRLSPAEHELLWGRQFFYRAFSTVNGGRKKESDLFEGIEGLRRSRS